MSFEDLSVFQNPQLQRIIAGSRRLRGEADTKERYPITKDLLLRLLPHLNRNTRYKATIQAAFCLAFAAFLRVSEFTCTARDLKDEDFTK